MVSSTNKPLRIFVIANEPGNNKWLSRHFSSRHPSDNTLCDDEARWWPLWYEYVLDKDHVLVYRARILLRPARKPDLKKNILWTDSIHLIDPSCFLHEPFDLMLVRMLSNLNNTSPWLIGNFYSLVVPFQALFLLHFPLLQTHHMLRCI